MTIQFGILFRLSIRHDFYDGDIDSAVQIVPTPETKRLLNNCRMLSKMNKGKLEIGAETMATDDGAVLIDRIQEPMELAFSIHLKDSFWMNYTDQLSEAGKGYFFSNAAFSEDEEHVLMHATPKVSELDQLQIIGNTTLEYAVESEISLTRKGLTEEDRSAVIKIVQNKKVIETRKLEEGLYEITEDGTATSVFITQADACNGIFHVLIDPNASDFAPVVDANWALQSPDFSAYFKNKSSVWRYHFTQSKLEHLEGIQITNGSEESPFGESSEVIGPDGNTWILISSNNPLAINYKPTQYLQLKKNMNIENKSEGVVIDRLPVPNKENLYRVGEDGNILTDLFINL